MKGIYKKSLFLLATVLILGTGIFVLAGTDLVKENTLPEVSMSSLDKIYDLIDGTSNATPSLSPTGSPSSSMHSISDLYVKLANLIQAEDLASSSVIYLGVQGGEDTPTPLATTSTKQFSPISEPGSVTGFTLDEIYDLIDNNNRLATTSHSDFGPTGTPEPTMHSLDEIYNRLSGLITASDIATGTVYLGVTGTYEEPVAETYTVTYDGNGNDSGTAPVDSNTYASGAQVTVLDNTDLVKEYHHFNGWNTQADGLGTDQATSSTFAMGEANVTLYAKWTIKVLPSINVDGSPLYIYPLSNGSRTWGCNGTAIGASARSLTNGSNNTTAIVNGCNDSDFAAKTCSDLDYGGYSDWYLPAKNQLIEMYDQRGTINLGDYSAEWSDFDDSIHYTSTENNAVTAWIVNFTNGESEVLAIKTNNLSIRCVR